MLALPNTRALTLAIQQIYTYEELAQDWPVINTERFTHLLPSVFKFQTDNV